MKTIVLEVDDESGSAYQNLTRENKVQFLRDVTQMMGKAVCNNRFIKLKKINDELDENDTIDVYPETLLGLLCIDDE